MKHEIAPNELARILALLRDTGNPEDRRIAAELEGEDLRLAGLLKYDPPQDFKDYIGRLSRYVRTQLFLGSWSGRIRFERILDEKDDGTETYANINANDVYEFYTLRIGLPLLRAFQDKEYDTIGESVCHELLHVHLWELVRWAKGDVSPSEGLHVDEVVERLVNRLSRAFSAALPDGWYAPEYLEDWEKRSS